MSYRSKKNIFRVNLAQRTTLQTLQPALNTDIRQMQCPQNSFSSSFGISMKHLVSLRSVCDGDSHRQI